MVRQKTQLEDTGLTLVIFTLEARLLKLLLASATKSTKCIFNLIKKEIDSIISCITYLR